MEASFRWVTVTAVAPVAWGSNYYVTREFLPTGSPLWGATIRALPAGILLLLMARRLPTGAWWCRSLVLGVLNVGAFFVLIYVAAQILPTSVASTVMATSPVVMMLLAWLLVSERPQLLHLFGAAVGIGGVALMVLAGVGRIDPVGVLASGAAMVMSSVGYVLSKRWSGEVPVLAMTSWQLLAGGLVLLPIAALVEGSPPTLDGPAVIGFGYVTLIATALAFAAWFAGLRHLPAGTVGLVGLLNPVTGVLLGTVLAHDVLDPEQIAGIVLVLAGVLLGQPAVGRWRARRRRVCAVPRVSPRLGQ